MALVISYDTKDALTTTPGWTQTNRASTIPLSINGYTSVGLSLTPDGSALWIKPAQYLDTWSAQPKTRLVDWNCDPTNWTEHQVRKTGDYWLNSLGQVAGQVNSKFKLPRNCGIVCEFQAFGQTKSTAFDIFDMQFGLYFHIFISSNGDCRLYDTRNTAQLLASSQPDAPLATGNISKGSDLTGKFVSVSILPYRRQYLLISSLTHGGYIVVNTQPNSLPVIDTVSPDAATDAPGLYVITESGTISAYVNSAPVQALVCISAMQFPNTAEVTTPNFTTPHQLAAQPALSSISDQEFGTAVTMTPTITYDPMTPQSVFGYTATFTSSNGSQPVVGAVTTAAFTIGRLHSPIAYTFKVGAERGLSDLEYETNIINNPISARLVLDQDRTRKSWEFELQNVDPIDVVTSLKDLSNRKIIVNLDTIENAGLISDLNHPTITVDPDAAWLAIQGGPIPIFSGYGVDNYFTDGTKSTIKISCKSMRQKLEHCLLSSDKIYDGVAHTDCVLDVLKEAGFISDAEADDTHISEIYIFPDDSPLPSATPGAEPLFTPQDGTPATDFLDLVTKFSGWVLDDLATSTGVQWVYAPKDFFTAGGINTFGVPVIYSTSTFVDEQSGTSTQDEINGGDLQYIAMFNDPPPTQKYIRDIVANEIYVVYTTDDGNVGVVSYIDTNSQTNRSAVNYVGGRWLFVLESASINSAESAINVCAILANDLPFRKAAYTFSMWWRPELAIGSAIHVNGIGDALVTAIDADFSRGMARKASYTAELVDPTAGDW